jgi:hypothetical protein
MAPRGQRCKTRKATRGGIPMHSQYRGVTKEISGNRRRPWKAVITVEGKQRSLGRHATELEAALAYANELIEYPFSR